MLLPTSFWGGWAAGLILLGIAFLAWLSISVYRPREGSIQSPDDVWDANLREGNSQPPKWWFFALFGTLIFSCIYIVLYPGWGDNKGFLEWNQHKQLSEGLAYYHQRTDEVRERWRTAPMAELRQDASAMKTGRRLFSIHCATCHGDNASGQAGLFPNLMDDEWHWGGSEEQILQSIAAGRTAAMPGWSANFSSAKIRDLADYVILLSEGKAVDDHPAGANYMANCVACHGAQGEGNIALGSPRFVNHTWQYTDAADLRAAVEKTIREGRNGIMPAQQERLTAEQIRLLAAWLSGGKDIAPVERPAVAETDGCIPLDCPD